MFKYLKIKIIEVVNWSPTTHPSIRTTLAPGAQDRNLHRAGAHSAQKKKSKKYKIEVSYFFSCLLYWYAILNIRTQQQFNKVKRFLEISKKISELAPKIVKFGTRYFKTHLPRVISKIVSSHLQRQTQFSNQ